MKKNLTLTFIIISQFITGQKSSQMKESLHQFKVTDLYGETFDMSSLKGKKVMIVNTASKCGLTYQYELLESLYKKYKYENFVIVGFPKLPYVMKHTAGPFLSIFYHFCDFGTCPF